jgi:hypothetical protein
LSPNTHLLILFQPNRPLIFLAHSLGGILVKDVRGIPSRTQLITYTLQALKQSQDAKYKPELQSVFPSTRAVIFSGTPHRGSDWISMAKNAATFALGKKDYQVLDALTVDSEVLQRLMADFSVMLKDDAFRVHSFMERQSMTDIPGLTGKVSFYLSANTPARDPNHNRSLSHFHAYLVMLLKWPRPWTQITEPCASSPAKRMAIT